VLEGTVSSESYWSSLLAGEIASLDESLARTDWHTFFGVKKGLAVLSYCTTDCIPTTISTEET